MKSRSRSVSWKSRSRGSVSRKSMSRSRKSVSWRSRSRGSASTTSWSRRIELGRVGVWGV